MINETDGEAIELIETMLQRSVDFWRNSDMDYAEYYVDAYRCAQENVKSILHTLRKRANGREKNE